MLIARMIALFELSTNKEAVLSQLANFVQEPVSNLSNMTIPHRILGDLYGEKLTFFRTEFEQYFSNIGNVPKWWNNNEAFQRIFVLLARNGQGIGMFQNSICVNFNQSGWKNRYQPFDKLDRLL